MAFAVVDKTFGRKKMFNTLKYAKIFEEVGFSREQSETTIRILLEVMEDKLFTKEDGQKLEYRLTIRFGTMLTAAVALTTALVTGLLRFI